MPLSKARNRDRMRIVRATHMQPKPVQPVNPSASSDVVQPVCNLTIDTGIIKGDVPFYNPAIHKTGDRVKIWQNGKQVEVTVP